MSGTEGIKGINGSTENVPSIVPTKGQGQTQPLEQALVNIASAVAVGGITAGGIAAFVNGFSGDYKPFVQYFNVMIKQFRASEIKALRSAYLIAKNNGNLIPPLDKIPIA